MLYLVCSALMLIGFLGLLAQTLLGIGHTGQIGHHAHTGPAHAGHAHGGQAHGHGAHHGDQGHTAGHGQSRDPSALLSLLSPLTFFSLCLGAGATGLLLKHLHLPTGLVGGAALAGGLLLYGAVIRPLSGLMLRFASTPSLALEGTLAREAEALTSFDAAGKGLVRLNVDGQTVRVLATLEPDDRAVGVRPGERLVVTQVDGRSNSCRVARL